MAVYALPAASGQECFSEEVWFPSVGESLVSRVKVDAASILGRYASRQRLRFVKMETSGDRIVATVLVAEGQKVKRGEVLGYYSYMFGLGYTEYTSPCDGEIVDISQATGRVSIKEEPSELVGHLPGPVERVDESVACGYVLGVMWSRGPPGQALPGLGLSS